MLTGNRDTPSSGTDPGHSATRSPETARLRRLLPESIRRIAASSHQVVLIHVAVLLAMFVAFDRVARTGLRLPATAYEQPVLIGALLARLGVTGSVAIVGAIWLLSRYGALHARWNDLDLGRELRWFVVLLATAVAWPVVTFETNYYFDQSYPWDRVLALACLPLIAFRPAFIFAFLALVFPMLWQLDHTGFGGFFIFPHKTQLLHVLVLFAAAMLIHAVTGSRRTDALLLLTCCLVAAAYWEPALTKIRLDWLTHGHLYYMPLAAYAHGWLAFLEPETVVGIARTMAPFDLPMQWFVLAIEAGCLLFLAHRRVSIVLLACVIVFHVGVFALYGYLFWTWIVLDAALLVVLLRDLKQRRIGIYGWRQLVVSALLIGFAGLWCHPSKLGWYDNRLSYTYRYEAVGESGRVYAVPPRFFEPYGDLFTMAHFGFLVDAHPALVGPYGVTGNRERADALQSARTAEDVFAIETSLGALRYDADKTARFRDFLTRYLSNWNAGDMRPGPFTWLGAPAQFWSFPRGNAYAGQERIRALTVREITTLYDGRELREIRNLPVMQIAIDPN